MWRADGREVAVLSGAAKKIWKATFSPDDIPLLLVSDGSVSARVDLDRLQNVRLEHHGADWLGGKDATPNVAALFRHAHIALPPRAMRTAPPKAASSSIPIRKRRGRPKRSATSSRISPHSYEIIYNL